MAKLSIAAALLLSVTVVAAQPFNDCDISTYYGNSPLTTSRADMHNLLRSTHRDQLPYTSSNYGDTWDALIALDNPNNVDEFRYLGEYIANNNNLQEVWYNAQHQDEEFIAHEVELLCDGFRRNSGIGVLSIVSGTISGSSVSSQVLVAKQHYYYI